MVSVEGPAVQGGSLVHTLHHGQASSPGNFFQNLQVEEGLYGLNFVKDETGKRDFNEVNLVLNSCFRGNCNYRLAKNNANMQLTSILLN